MLSGVPNRRVVRGRAARTAGGTPGGTRGRTGGGSDGFGPELMGASAKLLAFAHVS